MKNYLENYGIGELIVMVLLRISLIGAVAAAVVGYYGVCAEDGFAWAGGLGIFMGIIGAFFCGFSLFREMKSKLLKK